MDVKFALFQQPSSSQALWRGNHDGNRTPQDSLPNPFERSLARADASFKPARRETENPVVKKPDTGSEKASSANASDESSESSRDDAIKQSDASRESEATANDNDASDGKPVEESQTESPDDETADEVTNVEAEVEDESAEPPPQPQIAADGTGPQPAEAATQGLPTSTAETAKQDKTTRPGAQQQQHAHQVMDVAIKPDANSTLDGAMQQNANNGGEQPLLQVTPSAEVDVESEEPVVTAALNGAAGKAPAARGETVTMPNTPLPEGAAPIGQSNNAVNGAREVAAPPTPPAVDADADVDTANVARVSRGLQSALQQNGGAVTLRLHPPELGFVRIELQLANNSVNATLQSDVANVRQLLGQQLAQLRQGLENQGLSVERLNVQSLPGTNTNNQANPQSQQQESFHHAPEDGRSRGQFAGRGNEQRGDDGPDDRRNPRQQRASFADVMLNELV